MVNFTPRPLYPRESTTIPIEDEAGWAPDPIWVNPLHLQGCELRIVHYVAQSLY